MSETAPQPARTRLSGRSMAVVPSTKGRGFTFTFTFVFGAVFVLVGSGIIALSAGWLTLEGSRFHAPRAVIGLVGGMFLLAGTGIWATSVGGLRHNARLSRATRDHPDEPAMADHPWDPEGSTIPRWKEAAMAGALLGFLIVFLAPFNWWAFFSEDGVIPVKLIVGLFDAITIFVAWQCAKKLGHAVKFRPGRVTWPVFPMPLARQISFTWTPPPGAQPWTGGSATLRCVEQITRVTSSGKNRRTEIIHEEVWRESIAIDASSALPEPVTVTFSPPDDAPGTCLQQKVPVYWEFELHLACEGIDREERHLVPIYRLATG